MAMIKVIRGGCGIVYTDAHGNARHALKTPESGPFECDDTQAARLVGLGVADYCNELGWRQVADPAPQTDEQQTEQQKEQTDDTQEPEKLVGHLAAEQLEEMGYNELKKLAADMGVKPEGKTKDDYIAALVAVEVELGDEVDPDEDDGDELPELSAADPE